MRKVPPNTTLCVRYTQQGTQVPPLPNYVCVEGSTLTEAAVCCVFFGGGQRTQDFKVTTQFGLQSAVCMCARVRACALCVCPAHRWSLWSPVAPRPPVRNVRARAFRAAKGRGCRGPKGGLRFLTSRSRCTGRTDSIVSSLRGAHQEREHAQDAQRGTGGQGEDRVEGGSCVSRLLRNLPTVHEQQFG